MFWTNKLGIIGPKSDHQTIRLSSTLLTEKPFASKSSPAPTGMLCGKSMWNRITSFPAVEGSWNPYAFLRNHEKLPTVFFVDHISQKCEQKHQTWVPKNIQNTKNGSQKNIQSTSLICLRFHTQSSQPPASLWGMPSPAISKAAPGLSTFFSVLKKNFWWLYTRKNSARKKK